MEDFEVSELIFLNLERKGEQKRKELSKNCFTFFSLLCSEMTEEEMDREREREEMLKEIEELEKKIHDMKN